MSTEAMTIREPPTLPCSVGDVIDGRYRIDGVRASGGMGTVFRATHLLLARPVALKVVSSKVLKLPGGVARFIREARLATQLSSGHIVKVFDGGLLEGRTPYLVMEWLEGRDLAQVINRTGPLHVETAVDYMLQACEALAEVHARGIIHRDLKPSNLFLTRGPDGLPELKLLDFGVSKVPQGTSATASPRLTLRGTVLGSPAYMSPEQMGEAEAADERTDIWGIGVVLYEVLTQALPFEGGSLTETLATILTSVPVHPSTLSSAIPPALGDVILKCLKADPEERYRDVVELAQELAPFGATDAAARVLRIRELSQANRRTPLPEEVRIGELELDEVISHKYLAGEPSDTLPAAIEGEKAKAVSGARRRRTHGTFVAAAALAGSFAFLGAAARSHSATSEPVKSVEAPAGAWPGADVVRMPAAAAPGLAHTHGRRAVLPGKAHAMTLDAHHAPLDRDLWLVAPAAAASSAPARTPADLEATAATNP